MNKSFAMIIFSACIILSASASVYAGDYDADPINLGSDTGSDQQSGLGSIR